MAPTLTAPAGTQLPLFVYINMDDELLLNSPNAAWYKTLKLFKWDDYRELAASYYNALYDFNKSKQTSSASPKKNNNETKEEGRQRCLFSRSTMDDLQPVLESVKAKTTSEDNPVVSPQSVSPGVVPSRAGGKKPKCFFGLYKAFIGVSIMGHPPEPETVLEFLNSNLSFARVCGFYPNNMESYSYEDVPSLRKLEQFDQIMTMYGLWDKAKWKVVKQNIENEIIQIEKELVGDTTHYYAYSSFETVSYIDEKGKEQKKSQSKMTKNCRCKERDNCPHGWVLADDGAGTIVKAHNKMYWGHKASVLGFPIQGIPLDIIAVSDASTHDGKTFYPHIELLFQNIPEIKTNIKTVIYDSACDSKELKDKFKDDLNIELKASLNPRRITTITEDLPKGMSKLTPCGNLICNAEITMDYQGMRYENDQFIYKAPVNEDQVSVCKDCELKEQCCPNATNGRIVNVPFNLLPHIDKKDPPMAKRFKAIMTRRPSIERMIKRLKCDLSDDRLTKRSNKSFQAYLDKTLIAFHILLQE